MAVDWCTAPSRRCGPIRPIRRGVGSIAATRVRRVAQQRGPIREPLLTTTAGTILDGHARWQVALDRQQPTLPCIEYDLTEEEALQFVIERHRTSEGLNNFCRIVMALELEPYFRERSHRRRPTTGARTPSSNLTNDEHRDVRKDIARVAGVSTGNVTKVKQLLGSVIPATRDRLLQGEISIHRAWQWRTLTAKAQRDALWAHLHRGAIKRRSTGWSGRTLTLVCLPNPSMWRPPCSADLRPATRPTSRWRLWMFQGEPWW